MAFQTLHARLVRSTSLSDYTKHFEFEVEGADHFGFVPGQWLSLTHTKPDGEELTRAYSIASPPDGNRFAFCLNRVQDGFMLSERSISYLCLARQDSSALPQNQHSYYTKTKYGPKGGEAQ